MEVLRAARQAGCPFYGIDSRPSCWMPAGAVAGRVIMGRGPSRQSSSSSSPTT